MSLALYDPAGRRVRELISDRLPAGTHEARWDGRDWQGNRVPNGLYFARLSVEGQVLRSRLLVAR